MRRAGILSRGSWATPSSEITLLDFQAKICTAAANDSYLQWRCVRRGPPPSVKRLWVVMLFLDRFLAAGIDQVASRSSLVHGLRTRIPWSKLAQPDLTHLHQPDVVRSTDIFTGRKLVPLFNALPFFNRLILIGFCNP